MIYIKIATQNTIKKIGNDTICKNIIHNKFKKFQTKKKIQKKKKKYCNSNNN